VRYKYLLVSNKILLLIINFLNNSVELIMGSPAVLHRQMNILTLTSRQHLCIRCMLNIHSWRRGAS